MGRSHFILIHFMNQLQKVSRALRFFLIPICELVPNVFNVWLTLWIGLLMMSIYTKVFIPYGRITGPDLLLSASRNVQGPVCFTVSAYDPDLWPHPWSCPWIFKAKFWNNPILGMGVRLISIEMDIFMFSYLYSVTEHHGRTVWLNGPSCIVDIFEMK